MAIAPGQASKNELSILLRSYLHLRPDFRIGFLGALSAKKRGAKMTPGNEFDVPFIDPHDFPGLGPGECLRLLHAKAPVIHGSTQNCCAENCGLPHGVQ